MAVSTYFNEELALVDPARSFTYTLDTSTYGENEYSVSGWTVTGGSEAAQAHGADAALYDMGFRFYTPYHIYRPASVPAGGVTIAKRENAMPYLRFFFTYNFGSSSLPEHIANNRWLTLNNLNDLRAPVGHAWPTIINAINASGSPLDPTYYVAGGQPYFVLDDGPIEAALVNIVGDYMAANLNAYNKASFDPNDGSAYDTDTYLRFANAVMDRTRLTVPDAQFGFYAYAGQRAPPVTQTADRFYVQVALGFNHLGIGYPALVGAWGAAAAAVTLRGYGDISAWQGYQLMRSGFCAKTYCDGSVLNVPDYIAAGVKGMNLETGANHVKNIIAHYHAIRYMQTGSSTYDAVKDEVVANIYDDDSLVGDLFDLWGTRGLSTQSLVDSCAIVDAMADTWYRLEFRQQLALTMQHRYLTDGTAKPSGQYFTRLEQNLRWWKGLEDSGFHSYSYIRQLANSNTDASRPDLSFDANPAAHWERYPATPTDADYATLRDREIAKVSEYPAEVTDSGPVVMVGVAPTGSAGNGSTAPPATPAFRSRSATDVICLGPGTLTVDYAGPPARQEVIAVPSGLNQYWMSGGNFRAEYTSAFMWWNSSSVDQHYADWGAESAPAYWIYVPEIARGKNGLTSNNRLSVTDSALGNLDLQGSVQRRDLTPGVLKVRTSLTVGLTTSGSCNKWFGLHPQWHLMPLALAKREFQSKSFAGPTFTPAVLAQGREDTETA